MPEPTGTRASQIKGAQGPPVASVNTAIRHVLEMRNKTRDSLSRRICLRRACFMKASSDVSHYLIDVLVADSNLTQSQLLSSALRRKPGIKVNCCRGELPDCVQALRSVPADVVLLGGGATDHKQLATLRSLHASHPQVGLILLVDSYDRNLVVNAMRAGARGLFCRACQPFQALSRCISVVHQGQF